MSDTEEPLIGTNCCLLWAGDEDGDDDLSLEFPTVRCGGLSSFVGRSIQLQEKSQERFLFNEIIVHKSIQIINILLSLDGVIRPELLASIIT